MTDMGFTDRIGNLNPARMSDDDWTSLRLHAEMVFTPGTPIKEQDLFAGRSEQIEKLKQRIRLAGSHAIIYGERGVGKSSLVNVFRYIASRPPYSIHYIRIAAARNDKFRDVFEKIFKRISVLSGEQQVRIADAYKDRDITPDDVLIEIEAFSQASIPIFVIDEFDRIEDSKTKELISDTIKLVSDEGANVTFFIVGIADSVDDLLIGHESLGRALAQVEMPRMKDSEIVDIIQTRVRQLGFRITQEALWNCVFICKGLPYYAHLLGLHATQVSCDRKTSLIDEDEIKEASERSISQSNQSIQEGFDVAIESERQDNIFFKVLISCALSEKDNFGRFTAKSVASRLTELTGEKYDVPAFSYHLNEFCNIDRNRVLEKMGNKRKFKFRFREALMEPYVILQAIKSRVIADSHIKKFRPRRQGDLFST